MGQTSSALPEAQPEPAKVKASKPIKGLLYAQLGMDSENKTKEVRLSQKFAMSPHTSMKLFGAFTDGQNPRCRLQVVHKHYLNGLDIRVNGRLRYDFSKSFLKSSLCAKKKIVLNPTTSLNAKLEATHRVSAGEAVMKGGPIMANPLDEQVEFNGKLELSKKVLNITTTQDCRLRLGVDVASQKMYLQLRENHVAVEYDSTGYWNILYDF